MLLISAGLAIVFQDDMAIKMRGTIVGLIGAALFLSDGLLGGNRLGKGMARYLPYNDLEPGRLAVGMGLLGLVLAGINYLVAKFASTDVWLFYSTFVDFIRSEEHTSELQSLMRISYAVFCLQKQKTNYTHHRHTMY